MKKSKMYDYLIGEHIVLRKAKDDDYQSMLLHVWSNEEVYQWMLFKPTLTIEDAIDRNNRSMVFQKGNYAYYIALKGSDEAIGLCAIKELEDKQFEECGICIGSNFFGKGYGKEVVGLLLDLAFNKLGAEVFKYGCFVDNDRSRRLALHFGFTFKETYTMVRPWDGTEKVIDSFILTKEQYRLLRRK